MPSVTPEKIVKILKCLVCLSDGHVGLCDGIEYEGKLWLVPVWRSHPTEPYATPERIIRFDNFPHQCGFEGEDLDYQNIQIPISDADLYGSLPLQIEHVDHPQNLRVHNLKFDDNPPGLQPH